MPNTRGVPWPLGPRGSDLAFCPAMGVPEAFPHAVDGVRHGAFPIASGVTFDRLGNRASSTRGTSGSDLAFCPAIGVPEVFHHGVDERPHSPFPNATGVTFDRCKDGV